jgi:hypothetical protein
MPAFRWRPGRSFLEFAALQLNGRYAFSCIHPTATKQELLDFAKQIDDKFGHLFDPPIRLASGATPVENPF